MPQEIRPLPVLPYCSASRQSGSSLPSSEFARSERVVVCSHVWIDPDEPPIHRLAYVPWVGSHRREMKPGRLYVCCRCGRELRTKQAPHPQK